MTEKMAKEAALGKEIDTALLISAKNPRGIPEIIFIAAVLLDYFARHSDVSYDDLSGANLLFILHSSLYKDDVVQFLKRLDVEGVESPIGAFNELYSKYKLMETNLDKVKQNMKEKVPEIERSLELVRHLQERQVNEEKARTTYSLSDTVFAKAELQCDGRVCIWLGASVMVEYSYEEAITLLETNLATALEKKKTAQEDLEFLRNQIITAEVNMARLYNYDVLKRRKASQESKAPA